MRGQGCVQAEDGTEKGCQADGDGIGIPAPEFFRKGKDPAQVAGGIDVAGTWRAGVVAEFFEEGKYIASMQDPGYFPPGTFSVFIYDIQREMRFGIGGIPG